MIKKEKYPLEKELPMQMEYAIETIHLAIKKDLEANRHWIKLNFNLGDSLIYSFI